MLSLKKVVLSHCCLVFHQCLGQGEIFIWYGWDGVGSKSLDKIEKECSVLQAQSRFDEDLLRVVLPGLGVSDLVLEHVYDSLLLGTVLHMGHVSGGSVLKS